MPDNFISYVQTFIKVVKLIDKNKDKGFTREDTQLTKRRRQYSFFDSSKVEISRMLLDFDEKGKVIDYPIHKKDVADHYILKITKHL